MSDLFDKSIRTLELPRVLELLADQAVSAAAKKNRMPQASSCAGWCRLHIMSLCPTACPSCIPP